MKTKTIKLSEQEEAALMQVFSVALQSGNFEIAQNVVFFRNLILSSKFEETVAVEKTFTNGEQSVVAKVKL